MKPTPKLFDELEHPERQKDARLRTRLAEGHGGCFVRSDGLEGDVRRRLGDVVFSRAGKRGIYMAIMTTMRLVAVPEVFSEMRSRTAGTGGRQATAPVIGRKRSTATCCDTTHRRTNTPNSLSSYRQRNPSANPGCT